jgi:hypothetical protein
MLLIKQNPGKETRNASEEKSRINGLPGNDLIDFFVADEGRGSGFQNNISCERLILSFYCRRKHAG